jgi:prepilin-type N-terminal cleavage/methylation domain-containing protein
MTAQSNKQLNTSKGFTLIELLVTIAIIAIISVVAVALFGNIQADARDGKRRAELESLANALEVNKTSGGGNYNPILAAQLAGSTFPGASTTATDPQGYPYCVAGNATSTPPTAISALTGWATTLACPAGYTVMSGTQPPATTVSWTLCTRLENKGTPVAFCRSNTQ